MRFGFTFLLVFLSLTVGAKQWTVLTEEAPPLQFIVEGEVQGVTTELVKEVLALADINGQFEVYPWARAYDQTLKRKNTLLYSTIRTPERESLFYWVGKLGRFNLGFIHLKQNPKVSINSVKSAAKYIIGAMRDDYTHKFLLANGFTDDSLIVRSSLQELLDLLYKGKIDSFIIDSYLVCDLARQWQHDCDQLAVAYEIPELSVDVYLAANKRSTPADLEALSEAFKTVKARAKYQKGFAGH